MNTGKMRFVAWIATIVLALAAAACTTEDPSSAAAGPGVENPAGVPLGSVQPGIGGAGNGGGVSGGGSGVGGIGQGAR